MKRTYFAVAFVLAAFAATPSEATAQPAFGVLIGNAGRVGGSPRGIDAALMGEVPVESLRIRAELGLTGIESTGIETPPVSIIRTSLGVVRLTSLDDARPFVGAGVGLYRYRIAGATTQEVSGYISGGFEIAGRRRAFSGELRLTAPLGDSPSTAPMHAGVLFGLKRMF